MSQPGALFSESQRFMGRAPAQALLVLCALAFAAVGYLDLQEPGPLELRRQVPLLILGVLGLGLSWLFASLELSVAVFPDRVELRFAPLRRRLFQITDILGCEPCRYRPLRDYGGWGLRRNRSGWAYTVSGDRGVRLRLAGGEQLLIGSQRPESLCRAILESQGGQQHSSA